MMITPEMQVQAFVRGLEPWYRFTDDGSWAYWFADRNKWAGMPTFTGLTFPA